MRLLRCLVAAAGFSCPAAQAADDPIVAENYPRRVTVDDNADMAEKRLKP